MPLTSADIGNGSLPNVARAQIIAASAVPYSGESVRSGVSHEAVADAIEEQLPQTKVLQYIDDAEILASVGEMIKEVVETGGTNTRDVPVIEQYEVRSLSNKVEEVRGLANSLVDRVKKITQSTDDMLGRFLSNRLGNINQNIRSRVVEPFAGFCGDIIVYQRNQLRIQKRIWETLAQHGEGYGTPEKPIHAIAHSLGGVITFDTAIAKNVDGQQLWLKSFTTFGSQAAFFHIIDQRLSLSKYRRNAPVVLPPSIGRWVNLWDTVDLLAFTAGTVFRLHDGSKPDDIPVQNSLSILIEEKAWTHSSYWQSEELLLALRGILNA